MPLTISNVMNDFMALYNQGNYSGAYDYLVRAEAELPAYRAPILCWQACMAARAGNPVRVVNTLYDAFKSGYWYHEGALSGDPDLATMQSNPNFTQLIGKNARRRLMAVSEHKPQRKVLDPNALDGVRPLLVMMHGNLGNLSSYDEYLPQIWGAGWRPAVLQSSQPMWVSGFYQWDNMQKSVNEVARQVDELRQQYAAETTPVVLLGFSLSGEVAATVALSGKLKIDGFIAVESFRKAHTPFEQYGAWASELTAAGKTLRAAVVCGQISADEVEGSLSMADLLNSRGIPTRLERTENTVHDLPPNFGELVVDLLKDF